MGFDEGQKIKVWLFVSWFFPSASLLCGRELGQLVFQTWLVPLR
jgi:hypothetical protein